MTYAFHSEAEAEFNAAIDYYEDSEAGLGLDFAVEIFNTIDRVVEHPLAWPILEGEV